MVGGAGQVDNRTHDVHDMFYAKCIARSSTNFWALSAGQDSATAVSAGRYVLDLEGHHVAAAQLAAHGQGETRRRVQNGRGDRAVKDSLTMRTLGLLVSLF